MVPRVNNIHQNVVSQQSHQPNPVNEQQQLDDEDRNLFFQLQQYMQGSMDLPIEQNMPLAIDDKLVADLGNQYFEYDLELNAPTPTFTPAPLEPLHHQHQQPQHQHHEQHHEEQPPKQKRSRGRPKNRKNDTTWERAAREAERWGKKIEIPADVQESMKRKRKQTARQKMPVVLRDQVDDFSPANVPVGPMSTTPFPTAHGPAFDEFPPLDHPFALSFTNSFTAAAPETLHFAYTGFAPEEPTTGTVGHIEDGGFQWTLWEKEHAWDEKVPARDADLGILDN